MPNLAGRIAMFAVITVLTVLKKGCVSNVMNIPISRIMVNVLAIINKELQSMSKLIQLQLTSITLSSMITCPTSILNTITSTVQTFLTLWYQVTIWMFKTPLTNFNAVPCTVRLQIMKPSILVSPFTT